MQNGQAQGLRVQYPQWVQYPYISQPYTPAVLPMPTPVSPVTTITGLNSYSRNESHYLCISCFHFDPLVGINM